MTECQITNIKTLTSISPWTILDSNSLELERSSQALYWFSNLTFSIKVRSRRSEVITSFIRVTKTIGLRSSDSAISIRYSNTHNLFWNQTLIELSITVFLFFRKIHRFVDKDYSYEFQLLREYREREYLETEKEWSLKLTLFSISCLFALLASTCKKSNHKGRKKGKTLNNIITEYCKVSK